MPIAFDIAIHRIAQKNAQKTLRKGIDDLLLWQVPFPEYEKLPAEFIGDILHKTLTSEQTAICRSVGGKRETNVQAAHAVGKTQLASWLALWGVFAWGGLIITTAPTFDQVEKLLWRYIAADEGQIKKAIAAKGGQWEEFARNLRWLSVELKFGNGVRAWGFSPSNYKPDSFQGIHETRLGIIMDEASGIPALIDEGALSCVAGGDNWLLRQGNPVSNNTPFQIACNRDHLRIAVWSHPNVSWAYESVKTDYFPEGIHRLKPEVAQAVGLTAKGEVLPQKDWPTWCPRDAIPGAVSIAWIEEVRYKYGENSVYWTTRVEGKFSTDSGSSIVPTSFWDAARTRWEADPGKWTAISRLHPWKIGVDVGDGGDPHSIAFSRGPVLFYAAEVPSTSAIDTQINLSRLVARYAIALHLNGYEWGHDAVIMRKIPQAEDGSWRKTILLEHGRNKLEGKIIAQVDCVGVGSTVAGLIAGLDVPAAEVRWGDGAKDSDRYLNRKAEDFWGYREALQGDDTAIAPFPDFEEQAKNEFSQIYYLEQPSTGKTKIEDKEKSKERIGHSPNLADAIIYSQCEAESSTTDWLDSYT